MDQSDVKLYRAMKEGPAGTPQIGNTARELGVRPGIDIPIDSAGSVTPGTGGMSVAPEKADNLPRHRRPVELGGTGKDPVWVINAADLGTELHFNRDSATHGSIEPVKTMPLHGYQQALANFRITLVEG